MARKVGEIEKSRKKQEKNKIIVIMLSVIIIILIIFLIINLIDYMSILEKRQVYANIIVSDRYGFDLNGTALTFGMVRPRGSSARALTIENRYDEEVNVEIYVGGEIEKFVSISDNDFMLEKNTEKEISFTVSVPEGIEYGTYEGNVIIFIKNKLL